jgi:hypothetical protein
VVVNEIFAGLTDWLEIQNISQVAVELEGWQVQWWAIQESQSSTTSGTLTLPGYSLAAGQRLVLEESGNPTGDPPVVLQGKILFNANLPWGVMGGGVALRNAAAEPLDFVRFGSPAWAPAPPAGLSWQDLPGPLVSPGIPEVTVSLSRVPEGTDTDTAADLCVTEATPGEPNVGPCLTPLPVGTLLITEVDPGNPEWIELYNPGAVAVDVGGWRIKTGSSTRVLPTYLLGAGQYAVIVDDALDPLTPVADATVLHVGALSISASSGDLSLLEPVASSGVDFLCWGSFNTTRPPPPSAWESVPARLPSVGAGQTLARSTLTDTDTAGDFCLQLPSLGLANATCP